MYIKTEEGISLFIKNMFIYLNNSDMIKKKLVGKGEKGNIFEEQTKVSTPRATGRIKF